MLEMIGADDEMLHSDLRIGTTGVWEQYGVAGYINIDPKNPGHGPQTDSGPRLMPGLTKQTRKIDAVPRRPRRREALRGD